MHFQQNKLFRPNQFSRSQSAVNSSSFEEVEGLHVVGAHHAFVADEISGGLFGPDNNFFRCKHSSYFISKNGVAST